MRKKKNKIVSNVEVLDFASEGKCIAKIDGEVVFIDGSLVAPGDFVTLSVKKKKKNYSEGHLLKIESYSSIRVEPFCEHFGVCGGCKWQHIPYSIQIEQKQRQVSDQLTRIGKVKIENTQAIVQAPKTQFYRNKLEYTFSNSKWLTKEEISTEEDIHKDALGFHVPRRYDKVIPINKCYLQEDPSNQIRNWFANYASKSGFPFYDHKKHEGFYRNLMIRTSNLGQVMVVVQFAYGEISEIENVLNNFSQAFPKINSLSYFINQKGNDSFFDLEPILFKGKPFIEEKMNNLTFRIGPKSFFQTNSDQALNLYELVKELANISPEDLVYDLYTGTGTIANFVANEANQVIGIEYVEEAIEDAKNNSLQNGISNTQFFAGDIAKVLNEDFINLHGKPSVIITDPPRAGMAKEVINSILYASPKTLVYVSCNAGTQARDLALLSAQYEVVYSQAFDMFPHTFHVENVVLLNLKNLNPQD